jgi:hypothetical protein
MGRWQNFLDRVYDLVDGKNRVLSYPDPEDPKKQLKLVVPSDCIRKDKNGKITEVAFPGRFMGGDGVAWASKSFADGGSYDYDYEKRNKRTWVNVSHINFTEEGRTTLGTGIYTFENIIGAASLNPYSLGMQHIHVRKVKTKGLMLHFMSLNRRRKEKAQGAALGGSSTPDHTSPTKPNITPDI